MRRLDLRKKQSEQGRVHSTLMKPILTVMEFIKGEDVYHHENVEKVMNENPLILQEIGDHFCLFDFD